MKRTHHTVVYSFDIPFFSTYIKKRAAIYTYECIGCILMGPHLEHFGVLTGSYGAPVSWHTAQIWDIKCWNSQMFWLRICYQWNIWEKLLGTRAASVMNDVYSHRSRGGTAAQHLGSTPPSPWQPAVPRSKTSLSINDALQMCLGLNWKQARQGCSVIKDEVLFCKGGGEEFCLFLTTSGETRTTSASLGLQFHLQPFSISIHGHGFSSSVSLASTLSKVHMESICAGCFWQHSGKLSNALGRQPGSAAHPCVVQMLPMCF